jgi:GNAT superfamily N-acetyltransferase
MIELRQADTGDIGVIREIAGKTWFVTYGEILSPEQMDYMFDWMYSTESINRQMEEQGHVFFIAWLDNQPLGYVSVQQESKNLFHLHKLYVLPDRQGLGLGVLLINKAFDFAREHSEGERCALELNVNRHNKALHFYLKMGMRISAEGDFDIGNGYLMNDYILRIEL